MPTHLRICSTSRFALFEYGRGPGVAAGKRLHASLRGTKSDPARLLTMRRESCRIRSMQADLGHELGEARVGAQGVGHRVDVQVNEPVDPFPIGEIQLAKGVVGLPKST